MSVPLDAIKAIHNAFRNEMAALDDAAFQAVRENSAMDFVKERYFFFNEVLVWHADGEEEFVFPAVEKVAPLVAEPYAQDHRGLDSLYERLDKAVREPDPLKAARTTAAFRFHLEIHLKKEDTHLYRIFGDRLSMEEQGAVMGKMAQKIPQNRFPEAVDWLFPLIGQDDRENMIRIWQRTLPDQAFAGAIKRVQAAVGSDWEELVRRIPFLQS